MQQLVMKHQLEWELNQFSLNLMGQHFSPMWKVSAKRSPRETQAVLLDQATRTRIVVVSIEKAPATRHLDQARLDGRTPGNLSKTLSGLA